MSEGFSSGIEITWDHDELRAGVEKSLKYAAERHANAAKYVLDVSLCQTSGGHDQRAVIRHSFGSIRLFERGTSIHHEVGNKKILVGADASCAWCNQVVDRGTKDRHQRCGGIIDHEFLSGQFGYCARCQRRGKLGREIHDLLTYSYTGVRPLAEAIWSLVQQADPQRGADIRLTRFLGDLYVPIERLRAHDMTIREYLKRAARELTKETVVYEAEQIMRLRETGANPVSGVEALLKA